jgi:hypothetical protein
MSASRALRHISVSVDRVERSVAVLEADDGRRFEVAAAELDPKPVEGMVYRVPITSSGKPMWKDAVVDAAEAERRAADLTKRMNALRQRDTGGDIDL